MPPLPQSTILVPLCGYPKTSMDGSTVTCVTARCVGSGWYRIWTERSLVISGRLMYQHDSIPFQTVPRKTGYVNHCTSSGKLHVGCLDTRTTCQTQMFAQMSLLQGTTTFSVLRISRINGGSTTITRRIHYLGDDLPYTSHGPYEATLGGMV